MWTTSTWCDGVNMSTYGMQKLPLKLRVLRTTFQTVGAVSPRLAGRLAFQLFQMPLNHSLFKENHPLMRSAERQTVPFGKGHLATYRWPGSGPAVLLVHGWEANASRWLPAVAYLRQHDFDVIAFDAPAHGHSTGRMLPFDQYAAAIGTVVAHYPAVRTLIAHSFGVVGSAFYLTNGAPTALQKVVFIGGPNRALDALAGFATILGLPARSHPHIIRNLERRMGVPAEQVSVGYTMRDNPLPALIVHDRDDAIVPYEAALNITAGWPRATLLTTEGLGHRRILAAEQVLAEIVAYLKTDQVEPARVAMSG
jgi:pimeloyl-ACP methyl ester carboxylesterase